uniref:Uncharacterized protein n=1 Tax=Amphimedon queenslandica TaxID=400682 RepID=A0A1X7V9F9_AMPQE
MWCLERDNLLTAQHFPPKENDRADTELRVIRYYSDWSLKPLIFQQVMGHFPYPEVDVFATRLTFKLPRFFSWRPDPLTEAMDAFFQDLRQVKGYANPPWSLIGMVLAKIEEQLTDLILIAPIWLSQPWYPKFLRLLTSLPLKVVSQEVMIVELGGPQLDMVPPLAVWPISSNTTLTQTFQETLQTSSRHLRGKRPHSHMTPCARNGSAGVLNGKLIRFHVL